MKHTAIIIFAALALATGVAATETPALDALAASIESQVQEQGIPGLAIVVVRGDEILMQHCYGFADPATERPVTPQTVFPIGSTAKPFTSTLAAALVGDGDLDWDDPITRWLPWFELPIRGADDDAQVLIRDLLSHRTGFFTMELIQDIANWGQQPDWVAPYGREGLLRAVLDFEPVNDFREAHNYSNVSMVAVAEACGVAAGTSWDELLQRRLLEPLGMTRSGSRDVDLRTFDDIAVGHLQGEEGFDTAMLLDMDRIAAAGGVWSTIEDLSRFLRFLIAGGEFESHRIADAAALRETWTEHIGDATVGGNFPGARYGLGWFLFEKEGVRIVEHGGNALGYSANLAFVPEEGVGYAMISNALPNMMQFTLGDEIWQALGLLE